MLLSGLTEALKRSNWASKAFGFWLTEVLSTFELNGTGVWEIKLSLNQQKAQKGSVSRRLTCSQLIGYLNIFLDEQ